MMFIKVSKTRCLLGLAAATLMAPAVLADLSDISNVIFRIEASNATGSGSLEFTRDQLTYDSGSDTYHWNVGAEFILDAFATPIATLQNASLALTINDSKRISGAFAVQAGDSDTTFNITMAQLTFGTLPADLTAGRAGLAANVTDTTGDGAVMSAAFPAEGMLRADYNGLVPAGTMFAEALYQVAVPEGSGSDLAFVPASGFLSIPDAVSDMNSRVSFVVTAGDLAGGNHFFEIVPEPAALVLLLAASVLLRRR
jgi:hypothetical protein